MAEAGGSQAEGRLRAYLHSHIPLSAEMGVAVRRAGTESVVLTAPLGPNVNHKNTVFGGSANALAILAAWSVLHLRLAGEGLGAELVIQSGQMDFLQPITGEFVAEAALAEASDWPGFVRLLRRRGKARIAVTARIAGAARQGTDLGRFAGRFVALRHEGAGPP